VDDGAERWKERSKSRADDYRQQIPKVTFPPTVSLNFWRNTVAFCQQDVQPGRKAAMVSHA
jgi:hypothetical protein